MDKKPWASKTLWLALIMSIVAFIPVVNEFIQANPVIFSFVTGGIFALLRLVSKGKIVIE